MNDKIMPLDIKKYAGKRYKRFEGGKIVEDVDTRDLDYEKAIKIKKFSTACSIDIESNNTWWMHVNELYNAVSNKKYKRKESSTNLVGMVKKYESKVEEIVSCSNFEALEKVQWY